VITITRALARRLGLVFRRAPLGIAHRGPLPPIVLTAGGRGLRAQFHHGGLAVAFCEPDPDPAGESIPLPLEALTACAGRGDATVAVEAVAADRTAVRWQEYGVPQVREYAVTPAAALPPFPGPPVGWADGLDGLLDACADAAATAADASTRYALNCLLLRGSTGELVATDGRQLLTRGGFPFPWADDVLVRRSPVFAARGLPRDRPVSAGRTPTHVVLKTGPWTLAFEAVTGARFPDVGRVIPDPRWASARLEIEPRDAAFLAAALGRLPGADDPNAPATLDLNGCVAVRTRAADRGPVIELVLSRSRYTGAPVRVHLDRRFLARALGLGFPAFEFTGPDDPVVARDARGAYAWQPLSSGAAVAPGGGAVRVASDTAGAAARPTAAV